MQTPEQQAVFSPLSYIEDKGYVQPKTAVEVAKLDDINVSQQAIENTNLNINAASNTGPQVGLDPEVTKVASSQLTQADINAINNDLSIKSVSAAPIKLKTQLVNEGPTYTFTDEYIKRFEPVKEEIIESPLAKDLIEARAMSELSQREDQLIKAGLRPGTTKFENALASGWSSKPGINQRITNEAFRENVVLPKEVENYISTKIPETDASNVARDYYNPDTGDIQYPTVKGDARITRDIYKERVIDNEDLKNAASGTSIRGTSRIMDIQEPKVFTRTDEFTGDVRPDRISGTLPTGGVPVEIDGQKVMNIPVGLRLTKNVYGPLPAGRIEAPQLSKQEVVQSIINPSPVSREDLTGGGAGMGVYGRQLGYVPGSTSKTAGTRPTQLPEGKYGEWNPTTQRDEYRDLSNNTLKNIIERGTYRSGKMGTTAKEAQQELTLRQNLNYPENYTATKQTTLDAMKVSDDIRRIYNSGRPDAQQLVEDYKRSLGWSPD